MKVGGKGDISESNKVWEGNFRGGISSPVVVGDRLYWINDKIANCVDVKTGKQFYQARLKAPTNTNTSNDSPAPNPPVGGRRGGGMGGQDYASPVVSGNIMYYVTRNGDCYSIELSDEFKQVSVNSMADGGEFTSTPAIADGDLFIRSTKALYCIGK